MKQKTGRTYIPALTGEYVSEDALRSWAREFFLNAIWSSAPAPLYSLRNDILPRYSDAFEVEEIRGHSFPEIKEIAVDTFADVVIVDGLGIPKPRPEFQALRGLSPAMYEAAEQLLEWSKRFNLTGKRMDTDEAADPRISKTARMDSVWPMIAALETILQWHFGNAGVVQTPAGLPLWRPKSFKFPKEPEILPAITLRTLRYDPRARTSPELLKKLEPNGPPVRDPIEENTAGWYVQLESEAGFRSRAGKDFERWLDGYVAEKHKSALSAGLVKGPGKRDLARFRWAAEYQVKGARASELANKYCVSKEAIVDGWNWVLELIRLKPRVGSRGRTRGGRSLSKQTLS